MKKYCRFLVNQSLVLCAALALMATSCLEDGEVPDFRLFGTEYNTDLPPGVTSASVQQLVENNDVQITGTAKTFAPQDDLDNELLQNDIDVFGDLSTQNSSILITMNRPYAADPEYAHAIVIEVVGPFMVNQPTSSGTGEISFGDPTSNGLTLSTQSRADTYFQFTITELDEANKRIEGNFEFLAKNENANFSCAVFNGAFNWKY